MIVIEEHECVDLPAYASSAAAANVSSDTPVAHVFFDEHAQRHRAT